MTQQQDRSNGLAWFHSLSMDEKVAILSDPRADLPARTVRHISAQNVAPTWVTQVSPTRARINDSLADILVDQRAQLDRWWQNPTTREKQAHLIDQRGNHDLGDDIERVMLAANNEPPCHVVAVIETAGHDRRTSPSRLSPATMLAVYLELKGG